MDERRKGNDEILESLAGLRESFSAFKHNTDVSLVKIEARSEQVAESVVHLKEQRANFDGMNIPNELIDIKKRLRKLEDFRWLITGGLVVGQIVGSIVTSVIVTLIVRSLK